MRILIHSNAPFLGTGYGEQTAQLAKRLLAAGHDVAVSAFAGLVGTVISWDGYRVYPGSPEEPFGNDVLVAHAKRHFGGDPTDGLILTLIDVFVLDTLAFERLNIASWVPVDQWPLPYDTRAYFAGDPEAVVPDKARSSGAVPIAMSRFGERMLQEAGLDPIYVPHGIDTQTFRPRDRAECRRIVGFPDGVYVVGMVAANMASNPPRKGFPEAFRAFAMFHQRHPDTMLYVHSAYTTEPNPRGINLKHLAAACGISDAVHFTDLATYRTGLLPERVAELYGAIDVLLNPSYGEGFGIPIVEAQAAGVPVIVSEHSSMTELCGAGFRVPTDPYWNPHSRAWYGRPSVEAIDDALESAYGLAEDPTVGQAARAFALQYDADRVFESYWRPALDELERRRLARALPTITRAQADAEIRASRRRGRRLRPA